MSSRGFYLARGTALAIHLGHRVSVDLDWFTPHPFDDSLILAQSLRNAGINLEIHQVSLTRHITWEYSKCACVLPAISIPIVEAV